MAGIAISIRSNELTQLGRHPAGSGMGGQFRAGLIQAVRNGLDDFSQLVQEQAAVNVEESIVRQATSTGHLARVFRGKGFYRVNPAGTGADIGIFAYLDSLTGRNWHAGDTLGPASHGHGYWWMFEYGSEGTKFARTVVGLWRSQRFPAGGPAAKGGQPGYLTILKEGGTGKSKNGRPRGIVIHISNYAGRSPIRRAYSQVRPELVGLINGAMPDLPNPFDPSRKLKLKVKRGS